MSKLREIKGVLKQFNNNPNFGQAPNSLLKKLEPIHNRMQADLLKLSNDSNNWECIESLLDALFNYMQSLPSNPMLENYLCYCKQIMKSGITHNRGKMLHSNYSQLFKRGRQYNSGNSELYIQICLKSIECFKIR